MSLSQYHYIDFPVRLSLRFALLLPSLAEQRHLEVGPLRHFLGGAVLADCAEGEKPAIQSGSISAGSWVTY